jgi:tetratricopeptide (TPR) repeat protein
MTTENPDALLMAQGYLTMYEAFVSKTFLLDSAFLFLKKADANPSLPVKKEFIRYYFFRKDYANELSWIKKLNPKDSLDAWTNYRVGEGYFHTGDMKTAQYYFQQAVNQKQHVPDFENKLAAAMLYNNQLEESKTVFEKILNENPRYVPALSNLSYLYLLKGDADYASVLIEKALALDPDYVEALMNKLALLIGQKKKKEAVTVANRDLQLDPQNAKAKMVLKQLNQQ